MKIEVFLLEQITGRQSRGGVARYIRHMMVALAERFNGRFVACSDLPDLPNGTRRARLPELRFHGMYHLGLNSVVVRAQTYFLNRLLARLKPALVFSPFFGLLAKSIPQVFTVYDFALELYPQYFKRRFLPAQLDRMRECYRRASALLCISESTRGDLLRLYPFVDPARVHVTHLGVDESFFESTNSVEEHPYILFVGDRGRTKNFTRLLEAFAESRVTREYNLRVVTPRSARIGQWTTAEKDFIRARNLESSVKLETSVSEGRLRELYRGAEFFVYPSEYEGFGLPILEAMASRTLVLCSNTSSMPEVGGDAVIYFDPLQVSSISDAVQYAARLSPAEKQLLIEKGVARARSFSWATCAAKTISIFEDLLGDAR